MENANSLINTPEPVLNDVLKIDGRWAQALAVGGSTLTLKFLDDGSFGRVNLEEYELIRDFDGVPLDLLEENFEELIDSEEQENIWCPDGMPREIALQVTPVFGEYRKVQVS